MDAERWKQIDNLLHAALERPADEQEQYLRQACDSDGVLLEEVHSLLAAHRKAGSFLDSAVASPAAMTTQTIDFVVTGTGFRSMAGETVSHYRVLSCLGSGGMGVVYEAEDIKLCRRVAMKFLPGKVTNDRTAFERMQREARAASALDHPNICSIYELGEQDGQPFIVMQLLEGETLREWIDRTSKEDKHPRLRQATELAIQITHGLEAAHQKNIIHRDIKPANIFVTVRGEVKILDFGLAKVMEDQRDPEVQSDLPAEATAAGEDGEPTLTETGAKMGTAFYMSPEQIRGEKLDVRTDLFSLGLVLFEMMTGGRAFAGDTGAVVHEAVLQGVPATARQLNPAVSAGVERILRRSLEKDRERRYQSAKELRTDLERVSRPPAIGARIATGVVVLLLLVFGMNVGGLRDRVLRRSASKDTTRQVKQRTAVAVLGFKNLSGKDDEGWISTALTEMLDAQLSAGQQLRVISSEDVARMKIDLSLPTADSYGPDTLQKIRNYLGSDLVVLGSYLDTGKETGGKIRVDMHLQDARQGETIAVISRDGSEAGLPELATQSGAGLRQKLRIADVPSSEAPQLAASVPSSPEATRLYAEGLSRMRIYDALAARDLFEQAIKADPSHALSHAGLAEAWAALGYDMKAGLEAKRAFDLSGTLPREQLLSIEARYREMTRAFPAAIEICRTLYNFFPDRIDYGLKLANVQAEGDQPRDALATIAQIRNSSALDASDARVDLAEGKVQQTLSDFKKGQEAAARAAEKGKAQGAFMIVASARIHEGWAWDHLGQLDKAMVALAEAREIAQRRNPNLAAWADLFSGHVLYDKGDYEGARKSYELSLEGYKKLGDQNGVAHAVQALGNVLYEHGKLEEAEPLYREQLAIEREIDSKAGIAAALAGLGNLLEAKGDLAVAAKFDQQANVAFRDLGNKRSEATSAANLGIVLLKQGRLSAARHKIEQAMAVQQQIGYKRGTGFSLYALAQIDLFEDNLREASNLAKRAVSLRKEIGDENNLARSQLQLAGIKLERGNPSEAETLARGAATVFQRQKDDDDGSSANAILGRALLAESKFDAARAAAETGVALAKRTTDRDSSLEASLVSAEVNSRAGKSDAAIKTLEPILSEADREGNVMFSFEARLALGKIELRSDPALGRKHLRQLSEDAGKKDFWLIARKAHTELARVASQ
jgi:eukaryotic-like serine/threonine-protein kinase